MHIIQEVYREEDDDERPMNEKTETKKIAEII